MANFFQDIVERARSFGGGIAAGIEEARKKREERRPAGLAAPDGTVTGVEKAPISAVPKIQTTGNFFKDVAEQFKPLTRPVEAVTQVQLDTQRKIAEEEQEKRIVDAKKRAPAVGNFFKDVLRATPRAAGAVALGLKGEKEFVPGTGMLPRAEKFLFGEAPVEAISTQIERFPGRAEQLGIPREAGERVAVPAVVGLTILDLIPGLPGKKKIVEEIAKEGTEAGVKAILKRSVKDIAEREADDLARRLAPVTDQKVVQQELEAFAKSKQVAQGDKIYHQSTQKGLPTFDAFFGS